MAELHFQEDGSMDHILEVMGEIERLAKENGCSFHEKNLSENGKKFEVAGTDNALKQLQKELKKKQLPEGYFWSTKDLAEMGR